MFITNAIQTQNSGTKQYSVLDKCWSYMCMANRGIKAQKENIRNNIQEGKTKKNVILSITLIKIKRKIK